MKNLLRVRISLEESNPLIWRTVLLRGDITFFELHHTIQIAMGWQNYHMFDFSLEGYRIGMIDEDEGSEGYGDDSILDCRITKLSDVISVTRNVVNYVYDFGDNWEHRVEISTFLNAGNILNHPICVAGEMACPPEDCGGIHGFIQSLKILENNKHPEYKETKAWMPRGYDPRKFDIEKVNKQLGLLDKYISAWLKG